MSGQPVRPRQGARAASLISTLLIVGGSVILLVAGALQLYTWYAQMRWERAQAALSSQFLPVATGGAMVEPTPELSPTPLPSPTSTPAPPATTLPPSAGLIATPSATATLRPSPTRTATPAPPSEPGTLIIPKLKVSAPIVTIPLVNGQWDVSKIIYDVGLLAGTGFPGWPGNAAISGHVTLKGRGDGPFRWLEKLQPNDEIIVQQGNTRFAFRVRSSRIVLPTDVSVLAPTEEPTLTLITCTDWDFLRAEYAKRLIVSAVLSSQREKSTTAE